MDPVFGKAISSAINVVAHLKADELSTIETVFRLLRLRSGLRRGQQQFTLLTGALASRDCAEDYGSSRR